MKEYAGIFIKTEKVHEQDGFGNKMKHQFTYQPYISIASLCFAFTLSVYTYVGLLCRAGISFCCQSHLVPVLFQF